MTRLKEPKANKYLPKVKIASYGYSISLRDEPGKRRYYLSVDEYTLHEYLIGRAYHWYDMKIPCKIPGWRKFEDLLAKKLGAERRLGADEPDPRLRDRLLAWTVNQDIRCYHLGQHKAKHILMKDLSEEEYREIRDPEMARLDTLEEQRRAERLEGMLNREKDI